MIVNYVPPPQEFAVLVVWRAARAPVWVPWATTSTPFADHVLQSNCERRRYPDHGRSPLTYVPQLIRTDLRERAWSLQRVE